MNQLCIEYQNLLVYPHQGVVKRKNGQIVGSMNTYGYLTFKVGTKHYKIHRFIYEAYHKIVLDSKQHINHINRQRNDNRIENLELVTNQQNTQHSIQRTGNYKGVCWSTEKKIWKAELKYNYKNYSLGTYENEIDAAKAYNAYALYLNNTQNCKYLLNTISEENYICTPLNYLDVREKQWLYPNKVIVKKDYTGVRFHKNRNKYFASIKRNAKEYHLGSSNDPIDCAKLYNQQALWFNNHEHTNYTLNVIDNYTTVEKNLISEIQSKKANSKTSSYIGVSKNKLKWLALLTHNKKQIHLGSFDNEIDAAKAYDAKATELNQIYNTRYKLNNV